jgi:regulator of RNase E activity RraA
VRSGDILFGDVDGVVVIPQERAAEVLAKAKEKVAGEGRTRDELRQGRLLRQVFEKYRIL